MTTPDPTATAARHGLADLSPDTSGRWWWACGCGAADGPYDVKADARAAWREHSDG